MTRLLMTADTVGGVWTYALELADAIAPYDVETHLATMGRRLSAEQHAAVKQSAIVEVHESDYALEWEHDPWADVERAGTWLLDLERAVDPHVIHLNGYVHGALRWRSPVVVAGHSDVLSWWQAVHGEAAPEEWSTYRDRVAAGLAGADAVVAPTADMLAALTTWYGYRGGHVVPNGRSSDWVRYAGKEPLILGAGRVWDEAKNLTLLQQVSAAMPWPVVIAGERSHPDAQGNGFTFPGGTTRFVGQLPFEHLANRLLRAAIFVLPARYEPFGLGPLEAAQAGCALVLGDIPSLREVWGPAALYVSPDRPDELEAVLLRLIDNPDELRAMSTLARARAEHYRPARMAQGYVRIYRRLPVRTGAPR